jgi:NAD(P)-dependent dehydrogenase (short-subunit alcohol dehydrogenase family)
MADLRFDDRVAIVTGAGRGLGRAYARLLASRGAKVVVNDIGASMDGQGLDKGPAEEVVQEIKAAGGEAIVCTDSVATAQGAQAILQAAMDTWGRLDVLVHNAGNVRRGAMDEISLEDFKAVVDVHLMGGWHMVRGAFPIMKKAGYGRVVLASSVVGLYGNLNTPNYTVSKMGLIGLCNITALEGKAVGIKANCILPGALTRMADGAKNLDTSSFPPTMQPEMVAPVVGYLAHESCAITGELLSSIGGRVSRCFIAETPGVYRDDWTIEHVAAELDGIRSPDGYMIFPVTSGFTDHMSYSLDFARKGAEAKAKA